MGAMTNAMGSIGGSVNKVGKGVLGGVKQVGGQIGVPGMKAPGQPGQPGLPSGGAVSGAIGAAQQGQQAGGPGVAQGAGGGTQVFSEQGEPPKLGGGELPQATGPAGPQVGGPVGSVGPLGPGGVATPGGTPPFLGGLGGMLPQLQQTPGPLTATGALGKQPLQTSMQKLLSGGGGFLNKIMQRPQVQQAMQQMQQMQQAGQAGGPAPGPIQQAGPPQAGMPQPGVPRGGWGTGHSWGKPKAPTQPGDLVPNGWGGTMPYDPNRTGVS